MNANPLVSIGLPVYNGELFLHKALDSLLAQTHDKFEILISDNKSNDKTSDICKEYCARDSRVKYFPCDTHIVNTANFNRVVRFSQGDYFMWATHNGIWHPDFIRKCLEGFSISPNVILVGTQCNSIGPDGKEKLSIDQEIHTVGLSPEERFKKYNSARQIVGGIFYGLFKMEALRKVIPMRIVIANDHLLLGELSFKGEFVAIQEPLLSKRSGGVSRSFKSIAQAENITNPFIICCPWISREIMIQKIILTQSDLSAGIRLKLSAWSFGVYLRRFGFGNLKAYLLFVVEICHPEKRITALRYKICKKR